MSCDVGALANMDPGDPDQAALLLQECTAVLTDPQLWLWAVGFTVVGAIGGALIGRRKRAVARDTILGAALGPVGWIISLCLPAPRPKPLCPGCKREVDATDAHCRHCGVALTS